ncbi:MAG: hypothetical protein LBB66_04455 [Desulfovibrio sp.]|nr:hypothetical protein [Desulfovibrio sp.]
MTEAEYKALHIELWQWLHDNPGKKKEDWPWWRKHDTYASGLCFACEYAGELMWSGFHPSESIRCDNCPLNDEIMLGCTGEEGAFARWQDATRDGDYDSAKKYAAHIRDAWREVC